MTLAIGFGATRGRGCDATASLARGFASARTLCGGLADLPRLALRPARERLREWGAAAGYYQSPMVSPPRRTSSTAAPGSPRRRCRGSGDALAGGHRELRARTTLSGRPTSTTSPSRRSSPAITPPHGASSTSLESSEARRLVVAEHRGQRHRHWTSTQLDEVRCRSCSPGSSAAPPPPTGPRARGGRFRGGRGPRTGQERWENQEASRRTRSRPRSRGWSSPRTSPAPTATMPRPLPGRGRPLATDGPAVDGHRTARITRPRRITWRDRRRPQRRVTYEIGDNFPHPADEDVSSTRVSWPGPPGCQAVRQPDGSNSLAVGDPVLGEWIAPTGRCGTASLRRLRRAARRRHLGHLRHRRRPASAAPGRRRAASAASTSCSAAGTRGRSWPRSRDG